MLKHKRTWKETLVMEAVVDNKQEKMGDQFEWKNQKRMRRSRPAEDSVEAPWVRAIEPQARIAEKKKPQSKLACNKPSEWFKLKWAICCR